MAYKRSKAAGQGTVFWVDSERRFRGRIDVPDVLAPNGKRRVGKTGHRATACPFKTHNEDSLQCRAEVEDKLVKAKLEAEQAGGQNGSSGTKDPTLGAFLSRWLEKRKREVRYSTFAQHRQHVELHIQPHAVSKVTLKALSSTLLEGLFADLLAKGLSPRTVFHVRATLRRALNEAVRHNLIISNPASGRTGARAPKVPRKAMKTLTRAQAASVVRTSGDDALGALWATLLLSGIRAGEACGLQVKDVVLSGARPRLLIRRVVRLVGSNRYEVEDMTKNGREREVVIPQTLADILRGHIADKLEGPVFTDPAGGSLNPGHSQVQDGWKRALKRAGVPAVRVHDARHTAASLAIDAGVPLAVVSKMLGHSSLNITLNTYGHLADDTMAQAASALDSIFREA